MGCLKENQTSWVTAMEKANILEPVLVDDRSM
jgi:hypothetical protein